MLLRAVIAASVFFGACNTPPLYQSKARAFLQRQGIPSETVEKLTLRQPLDPATAERLSRYDNVAVLHLVGANPGTPVALIERLAKHENFEVRTGVAVNPAAPLDVLLSLRTSGAYTTVNHALARNPRLPHTVLMEMYRDGEAGAGSFAMNPNCPPELMRRIAAAGDEIERAWLATNPNLPEDLARRLAEDESRLVRDHFSTNPTYGRNPKAAEDPR